MLKWTIIRRVVLSIYATNVAVQSIIINFRINFFQQLPPRVGRKRPQVNNQSFTQNALDRSEII